MLRLLAFLLPFLGLWSAPAAAQEMLANRSFEDPVVPANGNNFYATVPSWTVSNVTPAQPLPVNIIRPFAGYAGNPTATPAGGGIQYFDVNAASGVISQTVNIPSNGMVDIGGWFSVRDNQQDLSGLTINIRTAGGVLVTSVSTSFVAADPIGLWKRASANNVPLAAGSHIFEVVLPNPANFDLATMFFKPALAVSKTSTAYSDPFNLTTNPKLIPGGVAEYSISATSPAAYTVTSNSIALVDATPAGTDLVVTNIGGAGSGPAAFTANASNLTYGFTSLASTTDNLDFSNNGGASWTYTPIANANGVDPAVTHVRLRPQGTMAASSTFSFRLRYRVE